MDDGIPAHSLPVTSHPHGRPPRRPTRRVWLGAAAIVVALALGIGAAAGVARPQQTKVIVGGFDVGPVGSPERFNPFLASAGFFTYELYLSKLVRYCDVSFTSFCGDLAERWDASPDGRTYTFTLRDAKWQDGTPVTAEDLVFTFNLQLHRSASRYPGLLAPVVGALDVTDGRASTAAGFAALDAKTFRITLEQPTASMLDTAAFIAIIQKKQWAGVAPDDVNTSPIWRDGIIGSGPFIFSKYVPGEYVEFLPFADYYGGRPKIDKLVNRYFPDINTAVIALEKGEIDFTYVSVDQLPVVRQWPTVRLIEGPSYSGAAIFLSYTRVPAFADARVRRALMHGIDRASIISTLWKGTAVRSDCYFSPLSPYTDPDVETYPYDPARARQLLKEAGVDPASLGELQLLTNFTDATTRDMLGVMVEQLGALGFKIVPRVVDPATFFVEALGPTPKWTIAMTGQASGPEPDTVYVSMHSAWAMPKGLNPEPIRNAELDRLLDAGREELDPARRVTIYREACRVMNREAVRIFLFEPQRYAAVSTRVGNFIFAPSPGGGRYFSHPELWTKQ